MKEFPSVKTLFTDAWLLFKKSALSLFFLTLFSVAIYLLVGIVTVASIFVFAGGAGFMKAFSSGSPDAWLSLLTPSLFVFAAIYIVLFVLIFTVLGTALRAATVLFVAEADRPSTFGAIIKRSFSYVGPLFATELIVGLLVFGSFFVFFFPALLLAFFFSFVAYEVILGGKKGTEALKGSVQIVSQNFGEIVVRAVVYFLFYVAVAFIIRAVLRKISGDVAPIIGTVSFVVNALLGWYGLAYSVSLYKQAEAHTDRAKKASLVWMVIVSVIGWTLLVFAIVGTISLLSSPKVQESIRDAVNKKASTYTNTGSKLTQPAASMLAAQTFDGANTYRETNELSPLVEDGRLCAYAQRRLEQLDTLGRYDDRKGFYEDLADDKMAQAYFADYAFVNEAEWLAPDSTSNAEAIVADWTTGEFADPQNSIIVSPDFTHACVRANPNWLVIVGGSSK